MLPQTEQDAWVDPRAKEYATYLADLRGKLAVVSKRGVGSAAKASRSYFEAEIERVEAIINADRSEIGRARAACDIADAAVRAHGEQPVPEDEEGEARYYVRRNRLVRASAETHASFETAVQVHQLPRVYWEGAYASSAAASQATEWVAQVVKSAREMHCSSHAAGVVKRAVGGVKRLEAMHYGYWEERGTYEEVPPHAPTPYDKETRKIFEYRWHLVAKELGLETGPEPDGLVALPEYQP